MAPIMVPREGEPFVHDVAACQVCSAPVGDGAGLCRTHTDDLLAELRPVSPSWQIRNGRREQVPGLAADLEVTITRQNRTTAERNGGRSATRPLPWNEHASEARSILWSTLNAWALDVAKLGEDERDRLADVDHQDIPGVAQWLIRNVATLRQHTEAGTAHDEILDAIRQARWAIDRPIDKVFAGPCGEPIEDQPGQTCKEDLYGLPGKSHTRCIGCGATHDMAERRKWMLSQIEDLAAHSVELSALLTSQGVPIGSSTIRKWANPTKGPSLLKVVSIDGRGRKYYRIGDVLDLVFKRKPAA